MARRNIFQPPPPPGESPASEPPVAEARQRFPNTGAMTGMKSTLRDMSSNAVREIDAAMIDDGGPKDRLDFSEADVAELAESIRAHGQQVPIMVRPIAERPGYYRVVYGRRRLKALRLLGIPAKALVRSLSDEQAILAQGQENSLRLDPSFIEKALFAAELSAISYDSAVILDALAIDKPMLSRMTKVARSIPDSVIRAIGPAHGIGRRRWEELADSLRDSGPALEEIAAAELAGADSLGSDERFARVADAVKRALDSAAPRSTAPPALPVHLPDGTALAEVRQAGRALTIRLSLTQHPDFGAWLRDNAQQQLRRLHDAWRQDTQGD